MRTSAPNSELPEITDTLTIDGSTNAVLLIGLGGANARPATGLTITASNSLVKGLVINRFSRGVCLANLSSATGNRLEGCFVGTDPTGTLDRSNVDDGVLVHGTDATVGGTTPAARNLLSGATTTTASFSAPTPRDHQRRRERPLHLRPDAGGRGRTDDHRHRHRPGGNTSEFSPPRTVA